MRALLHAAALASPIGPLALAAVDGRLAWVGFDGELTPFLHRHFPGARPAGPDAVLAEAGQQLEEYFAGRRRTFDLPLMLVGTPFQRRIWAALLQVPYGATVTYGELARQAGRPGAARAAGRAGGANPIPIIVP